VIKQDCVQLGAQTEQNDILQRSMGPGVQNRRTENDAVQYPKTVGMNASGFYHPFGPCLKKWIVLLAKVNGGFHQGRWIIRLQWPFAVGPLYRVTHKEKIELEDGNKYVKNHCVCAGGGGGGVAGV
jgi:hypothetical protein